MNLQVKELDSEIDRLRSELEQFDISVMNKEMLEASQRLDTVLNRYYALVYKRSVNKR